MSPFLRLLFGSTFLATPLQASLCPDIAEAERLEAAVLNEPINAQALDRAAQHAETLSEYAPNDPTLAQAITRYTDRVQRIETVAQADLNTRWSAHEAAEHRELVRQMVWASLAICQDEGSGPGRGDQLVASDGINGDATLLSSLSWQVISAAIVAMIGSIVVSGVLIAQAFKRKKARGKRYPCKIKTMAQSRQDWVPVTIFDISALGLKLGVPEDVEFDDTFDLRLDGDTIPVSTIWGNSYFKGCKFDRRLTRAYVKALVRNGKTSQSPEPQNGKRRHPSGAAL